LVIVLLLHALVNTEDELGRALVQIGGMGEDERMSRFVPVEELFAGRHFDAEIVVLCLRW
jgi:hypothetical protein